MLNLRILFLVLYVACVGAKTVTYDFNIGWVTTNPDGLYERPTIGINGQWPIPQIEADVGDRVIVHAHNQLGNRSTSLHFHGLYMNGSTHMDGPVGSSQCAIQPGYSMTYDFNITQPGTYWYHAHADGSYPDGLRGAVIINDVDDPYNGKYDEEIVLTLSDWYHDFMPDLIAKFINTDNPTGAEPVPNAALMNDTQNPKINVQPGKTYKFRVINMGAFANHYFWFQGHNVSIVEVDGVYTQPSEASMLYITVAQRYSFLLTTRNDTSSNFAIVASMDQDLFDTVPDTLNPNVTGWLVYDDKQPLPNPAILDDFEPFDDYTLVPYDQMPLLDKVDFSAEMNFYMGNLNDGANYAFINDKTYTMPKVPSLYTALTTGKNSTDAAIYGSNSNVWILEQGQVVEIVLNSADPGKHPFHLHGHSFQAVWRGAEDDGSYAYNETLPAIPMRRDTFMVHPNSNIVLRFRADNPGVWLFHCHIEWHIDSGLVATMVEAPLALQAQNITIPQDQLDACKAMNIPTAGNAAGNTVNYLDLSGENLPPGPIPAGFTTSGIVALVFSCIAGFLGMAVIVWYGLGEIETQKQKAK